MRATRCSWTIGQPCIKLITDFIYHGFKRSLLVVLLPVQLLFWLVIATINRTVEILILISHEITLLFIEFASQGESIEKEVSCHIGTYALC